MTTRTDTVLFDSSEVTMLVARSLTRWMWNNLAPNEEVLLHRDGTASVRNTTDGAVRRYNKLSTLISMETVVPERTR